MRVFFVPAYLGFAAHGQAEPAAANAEPAKTASAQAKAEASPARLSCRASRHDIGIYEPLRFMSLTVDVTKKYVKMVHEGDGKIFEYTGGETSAPSRRTFVTITDDNITFGQLGNEAWKIDRYTGTLTNSSFAIPFECQVRPAERKF
ncbi:MAG: hypothetical protein ACLP7P_11975 [Rhodomicrobium sp.]